MARVKLRCIMGCPGLKSSYREKGLFQKHNLLLNNSKAKMLIAGDSLVSNLSRYPEMWSRVLHASLQSGVKKIVASRYKLFKDCNSIK